MKVIKGGNLRGNTYIEIKNAFSKFLDHHFKSPKEISENYHLGIISWNLACSSKLTGLDKRSILESAEQSTILSKKEMSLLSKMFDYKMDAFPNLQQLIRSIDFISNDKSKKDFELEIVTMEQAVEEGQSYIEDGFNSDDDNDEIFEEDFFPGFIQRSGIAVKPKRNFANMTESHFRDVQWSMYLFEDESEVDEEIKQIAKTWLEDIVIEEANKYGLPITNDLKVNYKYFDANFEYFLVPDVFDLMDIPVNKH